MMRRSILLLCSLMVSSQAFVISQSALLGSPVSTAIHHTTIHATSALRMTNLNSDTTTVPTAFVSRRSALVNSAATATCLLSLVSVAAVANAAVGDESADDMVKRIAAQSASANAAARAKAEKEKLVKESGGGNSSQALVPAFLLASVGLSLPFFLPNLLRLGTKVMSGGENDGYGNKSNTGRTKKKK